MILSTVDTPSATPPPGGSTGRWGEISLFFFFFPLFLFIYFIQFDKVSMEKMAGRVISGFTLFHGREIKYYTYFSRKKSGRENKVTLFHAHGQKWVFPYKFKNPPPYKKIF